MVRHISVTACRSLNTAGRMFNMNAALLAVPELDIDCRFVTAHWLIDVHEYSVA
jgi:hypothetical protein